MDGTWNVDENFVNFHNLGTVIVRSLELKVMLPVE